MISRPLIALAAALLTAGLAACAPATPPTPQTPATPETSGDRGDDHGAIAGAREVSEPPLGLLSVDAAGTSAVLDLLDEGSVDIGRAPAPESLVSDGRYAFVTAEAGVTVIDSGRWSWDHGDHFHYYLSEPALIGTVPGDGPATVAASATPTAGGTGIFFSGSGEAVLLDNAALSRGEIAEVFRLETAEPSGLVAPIGAGALVADGDELRYHDRAGRRTGDPVACTGPSGAITTRAGLVIGCDDGAVLANWQESRVAVARIPYPDGTSAERARAFDGRKGRPTVAAVAGHTGFWLLDARERTWSLVPTERPLTRVTAVDDAEGHVVAIDADGRVVVVRADSGTTVGATAPLLPDGGAGSSLVVDEHRAYVNDSEAGVVHEIDFADGARIARSLTTPTAPAFFTEVGR